MIRRPPRSTQSRSSAASDVYKRQGLYRADVGLGSSSQIGRTPMKNQTHKGSAPLTAKPARRILKERMCIQEDCTTKLSQYNPRDKCLSLIHISEPTRLRRISYA